MQIFTRLTRQVVRRTLVVVASMVATWWTPSIVHAQAPANDEPCGAVALLPNGALCTSPTVGTTVNATTTTPNGYSNPSVCAGAASPKDVWYRFTTTATGPSSFGASLTVTGNPAGQLRLFVAPSCTGPFTQITCSGTNNNTVAPRLTTTSLQPNTTYYVAVAGYGSNDATGQFTICLTDGAGTPTCGTPQITNIAYSSQTPGTGIASFTPGVNNQPPFTLTVSGGGLPTRTFVTNTSPVTVSGFGPGLSQQTVTISASCSFAGPVSSTYAPNYNAGNTNASSAFPLTVNPTCVPSGGNLTYAPGTTGPGTGCAGTVFQQRVLWYKFTTAAAGPASTQVTITANSSGGEAGEVRVFGGSPAALTPLGCATRGFASSTPPSVVLTTLTPSTTYYVSVSTNNNTPQVGTLPFTVCAVAPGACEPPVLTVTNVSGSSAQLVLTPPFGTTAPLTYTVTYTPAGGTPVTLTPAPTASPVQLTGLALNTTYAVTVQANCASGGLAVPATASFTTLNVPRPANDEPCGAEPLSIGSSCTPTSGTTLGATGSAPEAQLTYRPRCSPANPARDVWYSFTTAATGPASQGVTLTATGAAAGAVRVFSASACTGPFTFIDCAAGATVAPFGPAPPLVLTGLAPNTTYYVEVSDVNNTQAGAFTLCVTEAPACVAPSGLAATQVGATDATLTFSPGLGASAFSLTLTAAGQSPVAVTPAPTGSPVVLTNLLPATQYTATLTATCQGVTSTPVTVTFLTFPAGGGNDDCTQAINLPVGVSCTVTTGNNVGATASPAGSIPTGSVINNTSCGTTAPPADVWFKVTVPANGIVTVTTSAIAGSTFYDSVVDVYSGTCGNLTPVRCNDDIASLTNLFSLVRVTSQPVGSVLLVRVRSYGSTGQGPFGICATTDASAPCLAPVALAVGSITSTSAVLSFAGSPSAPGSYTVTVTAAGGTPVSVTPTPTTSPVALANLQPGTVYTVSVAANCAAGATSAASSTTFTTLSPTFPCTAPTSLNISGQTGTSATLSFTPVSGATGYVLTYQASGGTPQTVSLPASATSGPLTGLVPGTVYSVSLQTQCAGGQLSGFSPALNFTAVVLATASATLGTLVTLVPNPARGAATVRVQPQLSRTAIAGGLYNALGQRVQTVQLPANASGSQTELSLQSLAPGVYVLRLTTADGPVTKRLLVE